MTKKTERELLEEIRELRREVRRMADKTPPQIIITPALPTPTYPPPVNPWTTPYWHPDSPFHVTC